MLITASDKQEAPITSCASPYVMENDPLGTPMFPIPLDTLFEINGITFKVQKSTIQGAGLGLFVHTPLAKGVTILYYGGDKYHLDDWRCFCNKYPRASKYSLLEDPKVECIDDCVYIVGDVKDGNVAGYINSCHGMIIRPNVRYALDPSLPPWISLDTKIHSNDFGHICVETISSIHIGDELFADYDFN